MKIEIQYTVYELLHTSELKLKTFNLEHEAFKYIQTLESGKYFIKETKLYII